MKYHIHTHNNPGIPGSMAVYPGPRPESPVTGATQRMLGVYNLRVKEWLASHLVYIKEPEWKMGDKPYRISDGEDTGHLNTEESVQSCKDSNEFSHYHEGQQIDPKKFKYVREEKIGNFLAKNIKDRWIYEWQEVKEPAKNMEFDVVLDQSSKTFGRPPVINPEWEQFQKGIREGTILLTPKE